MVEIAKTENNIINYDNKYLWRRQNDSESGESVVKKFLVNFRIEIADEDVRTDVQVLLVGRGFVDPAKYLKKNIFVLFLVLNCYGNIKVMRYLGLHKFMWLPLTNISRWGGFILIPLHP